jgi:hypothetical protein
LATITIRWRTHLKQRCFRKRERRIPWAPGDTIALSVTPEYLKKIGFIQKVPDEKADIDCFSTKRSRRSRFYAFGYLMTSEGRIFREISPEDYNRVWWELREKYQIAPPVARDESKPDAGAKYHIAANTRTRAIFCDHSAISVSPIAVRRPDTRDSEQMLDLRQQRGRRQDRRDDEAD